jgi:hypothetical protein
MVRRPLSPRTTLTRARFRVAAFAFGASTASLLRLAAAAAAADHAGAIAAMALGDAAWTRRAEGGDGEGRVPSQAIADAIAAYQLAANEQPDALAPHWKLVRALHFAADFTTASSDEARTYLDRATRTADASVERIERRASEAAVDVGAGASQAERLRAAFSAEALPDVVATYFWSAIAWGSWTRTRGTLAAVRQGVAGRLHHYAELVIALDPSFEEGGALRLLARLHATLPRVPLLSGWVDREQALPLMERALAIAPSHPGNQLLMALTLRELAPTRSNEANRLLERAASSTPRPAYAAEDAAIRKEARDQLQRPEPTAGPRS